jgi:glycosyltransferase involved in cell wall biosynthesis
VNSAATFFASPSAIAPPVTNLPRLAVVVPCFNESESLANLASKLVELEAVLAGQYQLEFLLVDDGSTDETWLLLHDFFGDWPNVQLVRHATNRGIAAAIATGLSRARAEIVASLDADCSYHPLQLTSMLPLLTEDVDLVVASPYHPRGEVQGVPAWRLGLSRLASGMYRGLMRSKLHTYTSCVRVYRRSAVVNLPIQCGDFVGIVELVWQLDRRGGRIVECPSRLTVRKAGQSKMRVVRTTLAHLRLLGQAAWLQLLSPRLDQVYRASVLPTAPH